MARRQTRRETEIFSISFLDCITCGLGSVVLLLVLSDVRSPQSEAERAAQLQEIGKLQDELVDIEGQSATLNRDLKGRQEQLSEEQSKVARLRGDLSNLRGKYLASKRDADINNELQGRLASAQETLTDEMKRLLGKGFHRKSDSAIGGIAVDSEYVIFLIDTSGSMQNYEWPAMLQKLQESLDIYPHLKGFQVMNDQGTYMFPSYTGKWIPDNPAQRKIVLDRLRSWAPFSASSPAKGIVEAISTYRSSDKKISIYVFGDEFTGPSIEDVVKAVDLVNRPDDNGQRLVRINAVGFPVTPAAPQYTSIRFATLMRIVCQRNGGSFVGLQEPNQAAPRFRIG
jgi:hypothetical protein